MATFARERDRAGAKISSIYDARVSGFDPSPHAAASEYSDPILDAVKTPLASAMADLTGNRLGWPVEARYEILNEDVNHAWDWAATAATGLEALSDLKRAMALDPSLRVLVVHGAHRSSDALFCLKASDRPGASRWAIRTACASKVYGGGHMLYFDDKSRAALREDARKLIEGK